MRLLLAILFPLSALSEEVRPQPAVVIKQADKDGRLVWHSRTFQIDSDIPIPENDLKRLARVADTTARAIQSFPLPLFTPPAKERPQISIHANQENYLRAGGGRETAGMYVWKRERVVLNANHLFVTPSGSNLQPLFDEDLVVHEIAHLCMHRVQAQLPQWLSEGLCEYFSCAHRTTGVFRFDAIESEIRNHLRQRFNPRMPEIQLVPLDNITHLNSRSWSDYLTMLPAEKRYRPYAASLLLTHYFLHGGKDRRDQIQAALKIQPPRRHPRAPAPPRLTLTEPTSEIQDKLTKYWAPKGLKLDFSDLPSQAAPDDPFLPENR